MRSLQPVVVDRGARTEADWRAFVAAHPADETRDRLADQCHALVRLRHGASLTDEACAPHVAALHQGRDAAAVGRWVYYPWARRLEHVLAPAELAELHLGTPPSKQPTLDVAVVGSGLDTTRLATLSHRAAVGTLVLVDDADALQDRAQRLYEDNPYARLVLVEPDALSSCSGLGAVVDAAEDFAVQRQLRRYAREAGLPVLLPTPGGAVVVERPDLDPSTAPDLDGLPSTVPDAVARLGLFGDHVPADAAVAVLEERPVSLGPAEPALALSIGRLAARLPLEPGAFCVVDGALSAAEAIDAERVPSLPEPGWSGQQVVADGVPSLVRDVVRAATMAPSAWNRQPWAFRYDGDSIWVLHDAVRGASHLDVGGSRSLLAIGAALENLRIAAEDHGHSALLTAFPLDGRPEVVARVFLRPGIAAGPGIRKLAASIPLRCTNRRHGSPSPLTGLELMSLIEAARSRAAVLEVCVNDAGRDEVGSIVGAADRIELTCEPLHRERFGMLRFETERPRKACADVRSADGVDVDQLELTPLEIAALATLARPDVAQALRGTGRGSVVERTSYDAIQASSAVGLLSFEGSGPLAWVRAGAAIQRTWLAATAVGLAVHPLPTVVGLLQLAAHRRDVLAPGQATEIDGLRERLQALFTSCRGRTPAFLMRLSHAGPVTSRSGRLPLERVLGWGGPDDLESPGAG